MTDPNAEESASEPRVRDCEHIVKWRWETFGDGELIAIKDALSLGKIEGRAAQPEKAGHVRICHLLYDQISAEQRRRKTEDA